jgi:hypothetical protein
VKFKKKKVPELPMCDWHGQNHGTILLALGNTETRKIVDATVCESGLENIRRAGVTQGKKNAMWLHSQNGAFLFDMWEVWDDV